MLTTYVYYRKNTGEIFAYKDREERAKYGDESLVELTADEVRNLFKEGHAEEPLTVDQVRALRRAAYVAESDPIKNEAEYDALVNGTEPDYSAWLAAVAAIKARYPLPEPGPEESIVEGEVHK